MNIIRVGFDLTANWRRQTGIFRYAAELAKHLLLLEQAEPHIRYVFFFSHEIYQDFVPFQRSFDAVICPGRNELSIKQLWYPFVLSRLHLDVMHYPTFPPPYFQPFGPPVVMNIHDAGPWRYPGALTLHGRLYFHFLLARGASYCTRIITPSRHAKSEIVHFLGERHLSKISVIPEAAGEEFGIACSDSFKQEVRRRFDLPERFLLNVSTVEPRKNLVTLLDAYVRLKKGLVESCPPLVIVGRKGWQCDDILDYMSELEGAVRFPGYVSDEELIALYQMATCLVFPSLYEGFGLPVLEAMAAGCPVITSNVSSLPEVAGEAAFLINPLNAEELSTTICRLLEDEGLRTRMSREGRAWEAHFTWEEVARMTRELHIMAAHGK